MDEAAKREALDTLRVRKANADGMPERTRRIFAKTYAGIVQQIIELEKELGDTPEDRRRRISEACTAFYERLARTIDSEALNLPEYAQMRLQNYETAMQAAYDRADEGAYTKAMEALFAGYQQLQAIVDDRRQGRLM